MAMASADPIPSTVYESGRCDRCGRQFPKDAIEGLDESWTFCEPCRGALWRDEQ